MPSAFGEFAVLGAVKSHLQAGQALWLGHPHSFPTLGAQWQREQGEGPWWSQELWSEKPFSGHQHNPNNREQGCVKAPGKSPLPMLPHILHRF